MKRVIKLFLSLSLVMALLSVLPANASLALPLLSASAVTAKHSAEHQSSTSASATPVAPAMKKLAKLPLTFEKNQGQASSEVQYLVRGNGYQMALQPANATLKLKDKQFNLQLIGANQQATATGLNQLAGHSNYIFGSDSSHWQLDVPQYQRVQYHSVYPGIDLAYYGNQEQLEYDFIVAPHADPNSINLSFAGADSVSLSSDGELIVKLGDAELREHKPVVYQEHNGQRQIISSAYRIVDHKVQFQLGDYDHNLPLIIDPVITYSTLLGGNQTDKAQSVAVDSSGNIYLAGITFSNDFPTTNASQSACANNCNSDDAFVTKISADGTQILYSTYLGGNSNDEAYGIAVDSNGNAYVTGYTLSTDFPTTSGAYQATAPLTWNSFVTKLNTNGGVVYSTYFGGNNLDQANAIAVDSAGNAIITGLTFSNDLPVSAGALAKNAGQDAFVTKLNAAGSAVLYCSYLGGNVDDVGSGVAVDANNNFYVTGYTSSTDFPVTANALLRVNHTGTGFVTKYAADGTMSYSTYLGGTSFGLANAITADSNGNAYVTGYSTATDFITTPGAIQRTGNGQDVFVSKINPTGSALVYSTYLHGTSTETATAIAVDSLGSAYITGYTYSLDYPATDGSAPSSNPSNTTNVFVTKFAPDGNSLVYSTYLSGAASNDQATGIAVDSAGNAYVCGYTNSSDFITVNPLQTAHSNIADSSDAFVTKISSSAGTVQFDASSYRITENKGTLVVNVTRTGGSDGTISVDYATADGTATSPSNYTAVSGTLKFIPGETSKSFFIPIINNTTADCGKQFSLTLSNVSGGAILGATHNVNVQIDEDDLP